MIDIMERTDFINYLGNTVLKNNDINIAYMILDYLPAPCEICLRYNDTTIYYERKRKGRNGVYPTEFRVKKMCELCRKFMVIHHELGERGMLNQIEYEEWLKNIVRNRRYSRFTL